jgi:uncharacterized protein
MKTLLPLLTLPLLLTTAACHGSGSGHHHPGREPGHRHVIAVHGIGEVKARPDIARITLGVEEQGTEPNAAVEAMTTRMQAILEALRARGIAPEDLQTSQLSIYSEHQHHPFPPPAPPPGPRGDKSAPEAGTLAELAPQHRLVYRVTNTVTVTVRKVETLGDVLSAGLAAGANHAGGVQFDLDDKRPLEDRARTLAMADAAHRAAELARLGGLKLGPIVSVAEEGAGGGGPMPMDHGHKVTRASMAVPTEEGQLTAYQAVRVLYRIER